MESNDTTPSIGSFGHEQLLQLLALFGRQVSDRFVAVLRHEVELGLDAEREKVQALIAHVFERQVKAEDSAVGLCPPYGMRGRHASPDDCIDRLRDRLAHLELRNTSIEEKAGISRSWRSRSPRV